VRRGPPVLSTSNWSLSLGSVGIEPTTKGYGATLSSPGASGTVRQRLHLAP
jgi:hypothetical protein